MAARPFRAPHEITDVFRLVQGLPERQRAGKRNEQDEEPLHDLNGTPPVRHRHSSAVGTTPSPTRSRSCARSACGIRPPYAKRELRRRSGSPCPNEMSPSADQVYPRRRQFAPVGGDRYKRMTAV